MKKILSALILCFASIVMFSQEIKVVNEEFPMYQGIVSAEGTAQDMYNKAKSWFAVSYKSANDVIQLDDAANATIIGKGVSTTGKGLAAIRFLYTIKIEGKENRFRYTITVNDVYPYSGTNSLYNEAIRMPKFYRKYFDEFRETVQSYAKAIANTQVNTTTDDEW